MITDLVAYINKLIEEDRLYKFYKSREWKALRHEVLEDQHYECQECLRYGRVTRSNTVHHVNHVTDRPDLALSKYYIDSDGMERQNLICVCAMHHNMLHPEKGYKTKNKKNKSEKINDERW